MLIFFPICIGIPSIRKNTRIVCSVHSVVQLVYFIVCRCLRFIFFPWSSLNLFFSSHFLCVIRNFSDVVVFVWFDYFISLLHLDLLISKIDVLRRWFHHFEYSKYKLILDIHRPYSKYRFQCISQTHRTLFTRSIVYIDFGQYKQFPVWIIHGIHRICNSLTHPFICTHTHTHTDNWRAHICFGATNNPGKNAKENMTPPFLRPIKHR